MTTVSDRQAAIRASGTARVTCPPAPTRAPAGTAAGGTGGARIPGRARHVPRGRRLRLGARGPARGRRAPARGRPRSRRARGGLRCGAVLAVAGRPGRAGRGPRPVRRDAAGGRAPAASGLAGTPSCRRTRGPCPSPTGPSIWRAPPTARSRSWPTPARVMREVARVLRPGGRWVFSVTHPVRWAFPDDPGPAGLPRDALVLRPHPLRGAGRRRHRRSTPSTTARCPTAWPTSWRRDSRSTGSWSRSGPRGPSTCGEAGAPCAAGCCRGPPSSWRG